MGFGVERAADFAGFASDTTLIDCDVDEFRCAAPFSTERCAMAAAVSAFVVAITGGRASAGAVFSAARGSLELFPAFSANLDNRFH